MRDLPPGWAETTTDALFTFVTSGSRGWAQYYTTDEAGAAFIRIGNLRRGSIIPDLTDIQRVNPPEASEGIRTRVMTGDILISITADLGRVALMTDIKETCYINQHVALARPVKAIDPRYLAWYLSSAGVQRQWGTLQRGATKLGLGLEDIRSIRVPIPPRTEQGKIVAAIEEHFSRLAAGVASLESARQKLRLMRAAVLQAAVTGQLAGVSKPVGGGLPVGWEFLSPDEIAANRRNALAIGPFGSNLKVSDYTSQGVPLVFVRQVRSGLFGGADTRFISNEKAEELSAHRVQSGDVLVTKMGEPPGDAFVYPGYQPDGVITADVIKLSVREGILPEYVAMAINSRLVRDQIVTITKGVAQQKVSLARFRQSVRIPLPPIEDQAAIVKEVCEWMEEIDRIDKDIKTELNKAASLHASILATAFVGELTPQDPADEPASALLGRIATERASSTGQRPHRGRTRHRLQEEVRA